MTALFDRFTVTTIRRSVTDIIVAYLAAFIAFGGQITGPSEWVVVSQIILAIKLHVFALPLAFTPVLSPIPPWVWYVISVMWLAKAVHYSGYTVGEMVEQLESGYANSRRGLTLTAPRPLWAHIASAAIIVFCSVNIVLILAFGSGLATKAVVVTLSGIAIFMSASSIITDAHGAAGGGN